MKKIGIIPNFTKDKDMNLTKKIISWIEDHGGKVLLNEVEAKKVHRQDLAYKSYKMYKESDFIIVLGGDGTLLGVARKVAWYETPILGVNLGRLGFLTEVELGDLYIALEKIFAGEYTIEKRMMLEAVVINNNVQVETFYGLNDVVISKGAFLRMIRLKTYIDDHYLDSYSADGIIISSPTGSTAYSLSAGGPIVNPKNSLLIITPISPHTLHARSVIISDKEKVCIELENEDNEGMLTIDGQQGYRLKKEDKVVVSKADFCANFIKLNNITFYDVLRKKLSEMIINKE
ncbi:NAD(+)/NADH kinase [Garciella nitratireducens]|uniref:NAD kinase n=1 Tax=Garciella nitratireducens DSM 15102 TaxID=1121911 RepID=A0A1T4K3R8_9FIRM|nr:NAD(+)/NADH kinase [Garciella nitratireducens]RBP46650.1 NAD+ kinase [Garciella nitratireducens]SJZ36947.1 NAD+ kinase [Garciella nitratireducens DSM 15102]